MNRSFTVHHKRRAVPLEHTIQAQLCKVLQYNVRPDVIWHAIPNAGKRGFGAASALRSEGMLAGVPDLIFIIDGRAHYLEMKRPGGVLSIEQRGFGARCKRSNVPWTVAYSLEEALAILGEWNALKSNINLETA